MNTTPYIHYQDDGSLIQFLDTTHLVVWESYDRFDTEAGAAVPIGPIGLRELAHKLMELADCLEAQQ